MINTTTEKISVPRKIFGIFCIFIAICMFYSWFMPESLKNNTNEDMSLLKECVYTCSKNSTNKYFIDEMISYCNQIDYYGGENALNNTINECLSR